MRSKCHLLKNDPRLYCDLDYPSMAALAHARADVVTAIETEPWDVRWTNGSRFRLLQVAATVEWAATPSLGAAGLAEPRSPFR